MEQDEAADCDDEEEEDAIVEDVLDVTTIEDEPEIDQVGPGSCSLHTLVDEETHMKEPRDEVSIIDTCVSVRLLVDEPYVRKRKMSLRT